MKNRVVSFMMAGVMVVGLLTGCGSSQTDSSTTQTESSSAETESASTETESTDAEAESTSDDGVLRVGMDLKFPPFSDIDSNGNPIGLEPTIAKAFGEFLGREVEIVDTDFSMLIPALETGNVDILIADMSRTDERALKADFSDPYRYSFQLALVNKTFAEENNVTDDMPEEEFFALETHEFVGLAGTFGVVVPQNFGVEVEEVTEIGSGIMEVKNGTASALVASNEVHAFHAANKEDTVVYSGITNYSSSSFVVSLGDSELLALSNEFIATMYEEGGLYEQIDAEYDLVIAEFLQSEELGFEYIIYPPNH
ncbi:MAG: transporter substrate-binding domain-containing protein [Eubacteriales bacterium]